MNESSQKGTSRFANSDGKKGFDKRKFQCFNCEKWGHYVDECWHKKGKQNRNHGEEANVAQKGDSNSDHVILMVTTSGGEHHSNFWFLDTCCLNYMTSHKQ